ncbi:MAG TPA: phosphoglucomutase/phosphomannomutase family protein [Patescibacteria group bacterium]|nr:phosphoglucomutase/phosphomannomutase family protein [Patescibacteria group bacterium]
MIRFGPAGWRGVVADEITLASLRRLAAAVAGHVRETRQERRGVFVGHDARFLAARFAAETAAALAAHGVPAFVPPGHLPTPAAAFAVVSRRRALGLMITGGHLAPEITGVKILGPDGAPAPAETLRSIETAASRSARPDGERPARRTRAAAVRVQDSRATYLRRLRSLSPPARLRGRRPKVACDVRHGAAAGWLDASLAEAVRGLEVLGLPAHPTFADDSPDCGEPHLRALQRVVRRGRLDLGASVDGDGDRFALVDRGGLWVPPNQALALLADYLIGERGMTGGVARSVATSHLIDAVCSLHGRTLFESRIGFASMAPLLASGEAFLGCEENGGLSLAAHLPQRDGLLAIRLVVEMLAHRRKPLRDQIRDLFSKVGPRYGRRIDYHVDASARERLVRRLEDVPAAVAGRRVRQVNTLDGCKMVFADGSWMLIRSSTTEAAVRCYLETRTQRDLEPLTVAARELISGA